MSFPLGSIATCQALCSLSEQVGTPTPPRSDEASTSRLLPRQLAELELAGEAEEAAAPSTEAQGRPVPRAIVRSLDRLWRPTHT